MLLIEPLYSNIFGAKFLEGRDFDASRASLNIRQESLSLVLNLLYSVSYTTYLFGYPILSQIGSPDE
jgi:hypothetical protein